MPSETTFSTIYKIRDNNGNFIPTFPINTSKEVYTDIDSGETLLSYLTTSTRYVEVSNDTARFALTTAIVKYMDIVKVTSTGKYYFITNTSNLSSEAGYSIINAVDSSGNLGVPSAQFITYTNADIE